MCQSAWTSARSYVPYLGRVPAAEVDIWWWTDGWFLERCLVWKNASTIHARCSSVKNAMTDSQCRACSKHRPTCSRDMQKRANAGPPRRRPLGDRYSLEQRQCNTITISKPRQAAFDYDKSVVSSERAKKLVFVKYFNIIQNSMRGICIFSNMWNNQLKQKVFQTRSLKNLLK